MFFEVLVPFWWCFNYIELYCIILDVSFCYSKKQVNFQPAMFVYVIRRVWLFVYVELNRNQKDPVYLGVQRPPVRVPVAIRFFRLGFPFTQQCNPGILIKLMFFVWYLGQQKEGKDVWVLDSFRWSYSKKLKRRAVWTLDFQGDFDSFASIYPGRFLSGWPIEWMNEWMKWMKWNEWNEMKWNEWNEVKWMKWNEWNEMNKMKWSEMKWNEMKWMN